MSVELDSQQVHDLLQSGMAAIIETVRLTAIDLLANVKEKSPIDQGKLQGSWFVDKISELAYKIYTTAEYAIYVSKGTKAHVIRPKNKKALKIGITGTYLGVSKSGYGLYKKVMHPGSKPNPFIENSIDDTGQRMDEFIKMAIAQTA